MQLSAFSRMKFKWVWWRVKPHVCRAPGVSWRTQPKITNCTLIVDYCCTICSHIHLNFNFIICRMSRSDLISGFEKWTQFASFYQVWSVICMFSYYWLIVFKENELEFLFCYQTILDDFISDYCVLLVLRNWLEKCN